MTTQTELLTAADLLRLDGEGVRGELIRGELHRTMPAGRIHGKVAAIIISVLMSYVRPRRLGQVIGTDAGILLERSPDTVREPDVAFISADKLPLDSEDSGYYEGIPDLVVEISSPNDSYRETHDKARMWLSYGVPLVWVADPQTRSVEVHRAGIPARTLSEDDTLDGGDTLPGFTCVVRDLFDM